MVNDEDFKKMLKVIESLQKNQNKLTDIQFRNLPVFYSIMTKNYQFFLYTWGNLFELYTLDENVEKKFNELYNKFNEINDRIYKTIKKIESSNFDDSSLIEIGKWNEQFDQMLKIFESLSELIEKEFEKLKLDYDRKV